MGELNNFGVVILTDDVLAFNALERVSSSGADLIVLRRSNNSSFPPLNLRGGGLWPGGRSRGVRPLHFAFLVFQEVKDGRVDFVWGFPHWNVATLFN